MDHASVSTARFSRATDPANRRRTSDFLHPPTTTIALSVVAVVGVWISTRVAYFNGYYIEDAPGYVGDAVSIALGQYQARHDVNGLNIGTYAPVALPLLMFGKSEFALSLWPLLCSLLGVWSVGGIAAILFGRSFGVLAAFLYATYPGDVFFSTVVMPDAIQSGWLSFSLFLVVLACAGPPERRAQALFAAGAAMGVCHLVRANGVILFPIGVAAVVILLFWGWKSEGPALVARRCLTYGAGWLLVYGLEALTYWWTVGDVLFRFHVVNRHYGSLGSIAQWGLNTHPLTIPYSAFPPLLWLNLGGWGVLNQDQAYHALLFTWGVVALLLSGVALGMARRHVPDRAIAGLAVAVVWFAWPLLYHQLGSQSLTQFIPIHRLSRHLVVYAPGAVVATVAGCCVIWSAARTRGARMSLAVIGTLTLLLHLHFNVTGEAIAYQAYHRIKDTYSRIRDRLPTDTRTIVADPGDLGFFDFWLNPLGQSHVRLVPFANYSNCTELTEGVVLTQSNPGWHGLDAPVIRETVARLPCLLTPSVNWRLLYEGYTENVYLIEPTR